jgi:hypothetical protein
MSIVDRVYPAIGILQGRLTRIVANSFPLVLGGALISMGKDDVYLSKAWNPDIATPSSSLPLMHTC